MESNGPPLNNHLFDQCQDRHCLDDLWNTSGKFFNRIDLIVIESSPILSNGFQSQEGYAGYYECVSLLHYKRGLLHKGAQVNQISYIYEKTDLSFKAVANTAVATFLSKVHKS